MVFMWVRGSDRSGEEEKISPPCLDSYLLECVASTREKTDLKVLHHYYELCIHSRNPFFYNASWKKAVWIINIDGSVDTLLES